MSRGQKLDRAGEIFAFQHDPEALGGNVYTVFDDESDGQSTLNFMQPRGHDQAGPGHPHGDADQVREPAGGPDSGRDR